MIKATRRYLRFTALAAALVTIAVACAQADMTIGAVVDDPDTGPSAAIPPPEDAAAQGDADATSDASTDVAQPKPTCTDEGWCHTDVPDGQTLRDVWGDGAGTVWTVSEQGKILRWDGKAWVESHDAGVPLYAIWGSSPTDLWVGGGTRTQFSEVLPGVLLHGTGSSPDTITWTAVITPMTIRSIWGTSASDVWAVASVTHRVNSADPSLVLHYAGPPADPDAGAVDGTDSGVPDAGVAALATGWAVDPVSTVFPAHFEKVWGTSNDDVWVAGRVPPSFGTPAGQVLHLGPDGDGSVVWREEQPPTPGSARADMNGISFSRSLTFVVGFHGDTNSPYFHTGVSSDDGATFTWTQRTAAETGFANNALSTVWGTGPNDIWIAGQRGRLRHWDGSQWRVAAVSLEDVMPVQNAVHAMWGSGPDDIWVVGADIALHKVKPGM